MRFPSKDTLIAIGGGLLVVTSLYRLPEDSYDLSRSVISTIGDDPVTFILLGAGVVFIAIAFRVQIRGFFGLRNDSDWEIVCREWLLAAGFDVREPVSPSSMSWAIVVTDKWKHEITISMPKTQPDEIVLGFGYTFETADRKKLRANEELANELCIEMSRFGLNYEGFKVPMAIPQAHTKLLCSRDMSRHEFLESTAKISRAIELVHAVVAKADRKN